MDEIVQPSDRPRADGRRQRGITCCSLCGAQQIVAAFARKQPAIDWGGIAVVQRRKQVYRAHGAGAGRVVSVAGLMEDENDLP